MHYFDLCFCELDIGSASYEGINTKFEILTHYQDALQAILINVANTRNKIKFASIVRVVKPRSVYHT